MQPSVIPRWQQIRWQAWLLLLLLLLSSCGRNSDPALSGIEPPNARQVPKVLSLHGVDRQDEYFWLRDDSRSNPEVLALIAAENAYTEKVMAHTQGLQETLFNEISTRLSDDDKTVPVRQGDFAYHQEFRAGGEYPLYLRQRLGLDESPEVFLDVNSLSKGHEYYRVSNWTVSSGEDLLAFTEDTVGRRQYTLRFKNLVTGEILPDRIEGVSNSIAWAQDNETVFYVKVDPQTLLPFQVYRHQLGQPVSSDQLVYEESDRSFVTSVYLSRSQAFVIIRLASTESDEIRLIDSHEPLQIPRVFLAREAGHRYRIRHVAGTFYITTNWQAENFRLMKVAEQQLNDKAAWVELIGQRDDVLLMDAEVFDDYLVVNERHQGLPSLRVIPRDDDTSAGQVIEFPEPAYTVRLHSNPEVKSQQVRYVYSSLSTPESIVDYDMSTGNHILRKQDRVEGGFDASRYTTQRITIQARDGAQVPVSLVYRTDQFKAGENPLYLTAYGAYGFASKPEFRALRLSLLDRGFVFGIVHVRGGDELGRRWYEDGKLLKKRHTFWDFMDATDQLLAQGFGAAGKVFARGGSAGGLLMGVLANEAPDKYLGIIAHVPFVDIVTTMLDETIPLTAGEYSEWGDPRQREYFDYMLSYSPYDQVKAQDYPHLFVTTGLHDSQVQYFEPLKWVSRLRQRKTDGHRLLMSINTESGHGGASGLYARYKTDALEYAFVLDVLAQDAR